MKKSTSDMKYLLLITFCFLFFSKAEGQFILAGEHGVGDRYIDLVPDSILELHGCPLGNTLKLGSYEIDMNGDSIYDFRIMASCGGPSGYCRWASEIYPYNHNQIAIGNARDSCDYWSYIMAEKLNLNDSIDQVRIWKDSSVFFSDAFLAYSYSYNCIHNEFPEGEGYVGVRVFLSTDTLYGWIKVSVDTEYLPPDYYLKIESFACNLGITGIKESSANSLIKVFPNPAGDHIAIQWPGAMVVEHSIIFITDVFGQRVYQTSITTLQTIDVSSLSAGVYFAEIVRDKEKWVGKFVKQ